jgi:hypothetical protein
MISQPQQKEDSRRTMFNLRVIHDHSLLCIRPSYVPSSRHVPETGDPPNREKEKSDKEEPGLDGTTMLLTVFMVKTQSPSRRLKLFGFTWVSHVVGSGLRDRRCVG